VAGQRVGAGGYLELLAVADPQEAASSDFGHGLLARLADSGDGLLGWAVAVDDLEPVVRRLGTTITTIRRAGLTARSTGLAEAMREPFLPFFIATRESRIRASTATPGASPGSRLRGTLPGWSSGRIAPRCRCESWAARLRYERRYRRARD
jgi:Glyoxalase-like domain